MPVHAYTLSIFPVGETFGNIPRRCSYHVYGRVTICVYTALYPNRLAVVSRPIDFRRPVLYTRQTPSSRANRTANWPLRTTFLVGGEKTEWRETPSRRSRPCLRGRLSGKRGVIEIIIIITKNNMTWASARRGLFRTRRDFRRTGRAAWEGGGDPWSGSFLELGSDNPSATGQSRTSDATTVLSFVRVFFSYVFFFFTPNPRGRRCRRKDGSCGVHANNTHKTRRIMSYVRGVQYRLCDRLICTRYKTRIHFTASSGHRGFRVYSN